MKVKNKDKQLFDRIFDEIKSIPNSFSELDKYSLDEFYNSFQISRFAEINTGNLIEEYLTLFRGSQRERDLFDSLKNMKSDIAETAENIFI